MKLFILAIGTRGDVELFMILGREMQRRGHRVLIGTSSFYASHIRASQLEWVQIGNGTADQMGQILQSMSVLADPKVQTETFIRKWVVPQLDQSIVAIQMCAFGADYFISNMKMAIRRKDQVVPGAFVTYDVPRALEDLTRHSSQRFGGRIIDLVAMNKRFVDGSNAWGSTYQFTGFWLEPQPPAWPVPELLLDFLSGGTPPAVITIGSMASESQAGLIDRVIDALTTAGVRGIILGNLAGAKRGVASNVYYGGEIPYSWLFPRSSVVVHHGGVGTAAAALAAGVPSVVLPQISAQHYLAHVLNSAGLLTGVFETKALDANKFAAAIQSAVTDLKYQRVCKEWKAEIARDRGVLAAADLIEQHEKQLQHRATD